MNQLAELNVQLSAEVVAQQLGDEMVLVHTDTDRIYELNPTAARFWELLSTGSSLEKANKKLLEEFEVDPDVLGREVEMMISFFGREGLLETRAHA